MIRKTATFGLAIAAMLIATAGQVQAGVLYATSTDSSSRFFAYDSVTNSWSEKASIYTRSQLAVDKFGVVHAYDQQFNRIKAYDAINDSWNTIASGPGLGGNGNLEILNDGRMLYTQFGSSGYRVYQNNSWLGGGLGFQASQQGDYDPFSDTLVIGEYRSERTRVLDTSTLAVETLFSNGAQGTLERRRAGSILDGDYYQQWGSGPLRSFDLTNSAEPIQNVGSFPQQYYNATAADREENLLYVVGFGTFRGSLSVYDPTTQVFTTLASAPSVLGTHTTAIVGGVSIEQNAVPEPTSLAMFGLGAIGLVGFRRPRRKA